MSRIYTLSARPALSPAPAAPAREALRLLDDALSWALFASERAPRHMPYYYRKALHAARFSAKVGARSLAVPSKLVGTPRHQPALCVLSSHLVAEGTGPLPLTLWQEGGALCVALTLPGAGQYVVGRVQERHVSWLVPLLPLGVQAFALGVSGLSRPGGTLGLNVAFGHVGAAVARCCFPYGPEPGGDGAALRVAEQAPVYRLPPLPEAPPEVIAFGRNARGAVVHVSTTGQTFTADDDGIEFGYRGTGPHRLALVLLTALGLEAEEVDALAHDLVLDDVEHLPRYHTTVLSVEHFRLWIEGQHETRKAA